MPISTPDSLPSFVKDLNSLLVDRQRLQQLALEAENAADAPKKLALERVSLGVDETRDAEPLLEVFKRLIQPPQLKVRESDVEKRDGNMLVL
eukprot:CAMPEP_0173388992 /NCGR_PEP_ID=MMETSP1356-20130122/11168_1 /TAXON_ID=77927 ORGANISM="Hemiselmis virescens, Strain PCC157" /NCGR_SAMPLE_ID=MMETSP1356 /ASSEMBLY_ACC=CAM_ASM_000847 /LENGTH=91 /DNA_ID=CAMNT_0014346019 /DNA_START=125 /DNA_END=395 /DNA_ORIENTATION=-